MKTRILVVCDDPGASKELGELLGRMGYEPSSAALQNESLLSVARRDQPGMIVVDGGHDCVAIAARLAGERIAPVLLIGASAEPGLAKRIAEGGIMGYVLRPINENNLRPAVEVALSRYREFEALARETNDLREQLEALQLVEQAKSVLMTQYNLSELEASRRIRKASDDIRRPMGAIAEAILHTQSIGTGASAAG